MKTSLRGLFSLWPVLLLGVNVAWAVPRPQLSRTLTLGQNAEVSDAAFSPDERVLYLATSRDVFARETRSGKSLPAFASPRGWSDVTDMKISPRGRFLSVIAWRDKGDGCRVFVWSLKTKRLEATISLGGAEAIAFSPDDRTLAISESSADYPQVRLIETNAWKTRGLLECKGGLSPYDLEFSPDGRKLAGTAYYGDAAVGDLTLWNATTGKRLDYVDDVSQGPLCFLPGGKLVLGDDVFDANKPSRGGQSLFPASDSVTRWLAAPLTRRGTLIVVKKWIAATSQEQLELWDGARKKQVASWNVRFGKPQNYRCSQNGHWLAVWSEDAQIRLYAITNSSASSSKS